jgi:hypothetical protein
VHGQVLNYFQSQTKVAAMIKNGTNFSAMSERLNLGRGDKDFGSNLYVLYMFIPLNDINLLLISTIRKRLSIGAFLTKLIYSDSRF